METYKSAFKNICRLCLKQSKSEIMVKLFDKDEKNGLSFYGEALVNICKVLDEKSEIFPTKMCQNCFSLLKQTIRFKKQCEQSEILLKSVAESSSSNDRMIQNLVESSLFWQHFPDKVCNEIEDIAPSASAELDSMEEMLNLMEFSDKCKEFKSIDNNSDSEDNYDLNFTEEIPLGSIDKIKKYEDEGNNYKFSCKICCKQFSDDNVLHTHLRSHNLHLDKDPDLLIDIMQSYFKQKSENKVTVEDLTCHTCNKTLSSKRALICHKKRHSIGNYVCEHCGKLFATNSELQVHLIATHNAGQGVKCNLCSYRSVSLFHLKEHKRLHTGERPFTCEKCGLTFRRQYIYKKHLILHTERSIKCPDCPRKFYRRGDMLQHKNSIHERIYMYACHKCGATYAKNCTVRKHLTERHGIPRELQGKITRVSKNTTLSFAEVN